MTETIHLEGMDELLNKLDSLAKMKRVQGAVKQAGVFLQGKLAEYPTVSRRPNPMIKLNDKARRGFFYHLKHGDIEVPYRRGMSPGSQKLGQSWSVRTENSGFRAIIGTSVSYAKLVQDSAHQTSYHRGTGWITTKQTKLLYGNQAVDYVRNALKREVEA